MVTNSQSFIVEQLGGEENYDGYTENKLDHNIGGDDTLPLPLDSDNDIVKQ